MTDDTFRKMLRSKPSKLLRRWLDRAWVPPRRDWIVEELAKRDKDNT